MQKVLDVAKALSDPNRIRALMGLERGELCVCQIIELLELAPSTVSKHMTILRQAGLVEGRKKGRWMYYRIADAGVNEYASEVISRTIAALSDDPVIAADRKKLDDILKMDKEQLCRSQRK